MPSRSIISDKKNSQWYRREYFIDGGWIKPDLSIAPQMYKPFDYYDLEEDRKTECPHLEFSSLDSNNLEDIIGFVSKWGILGIDRRDVFTANSYGRNGEVIKTVAVDWRERLFVEINESSKRDIEQEHEMNEGIESLDDFQFHCTKFQALMRIKNALFPIDKNKIKAIKEEWSSKWPPGLLTVDISSSNLNYVAEALGHALSLSIFMETLRSFGMLPSFSFDSNKNLVCTTEWGFIGLITAMYIMLYLDLNTGTFTKQCPHCKKWFEAKNKLSKYCSDEHQEAAKSSRSYKKRKDKINAKRRKGGNSLG